MLTENNEMCEICKQYFEGRLNMIEESAAVTTVTPGLRARDVEKLIRSSKELRSNETLKNLNDGNKAAGLER